MTSQVDGHTSVVIPGPCADAAKPVVDGVVTRPARVDILTLFPEVMAPYFAASIMGRAQASGRLAIHLHQLRDFSLDKHRKVDDRPFGGGPGMLMTCQPVLAALRAVLAMDPRPARRVFLSPAGTPLTHGWVQQTARWAASEGRLVLLAGHYEGVDQRAIELGEFEELSIGDYVLSGGELAAMVVVDAIVRQLPGVLGHEDGAADESFSQATGGLLEPPQYTRPREVEGLTVPDVLLSGDHQRIHRWRVEQSQRRTAQRRPDLLGERGAQAP